MGKTALESQHSSHSEALFQRLREVHLIFSGRRATDTQSSISVLKMVAKFAAEKREMKFYWLLMVAMAAKFPSIDELLFFRHRIEMQKSAQNAWIGALEGAAGLASRSAHQFSSLKVVTDSVFVDVNFCARHTHHTGIQRVVREAAKYWSNEDAFLPVAWDDNGDAFRPLTEIELARVVDWTDEHRGSGPRQPDLQEIRSSQLLVPWGCDVLLPEVMSAEYSPPYAAMGAFSENSISFIGYDMIPILRPDEVHPDEPEKFVKYLSALKHGTQVLAISHAAAAEFEGFVSGLSSQGLQGPIVSAVPLARQGFGDEHRQGELVAPRGEIATVICVGTQEPRKNQVLLLNAAESLWRKGYKFRLEFYGGGAFPLCEPFDSLVEELAKKGRPVTVYRKANDSQLQRAYDQALFSVFVSLHEGFGLPIVESLSHKTPVIASRTGAVGEVASAGGCLMINPESQPDLENAMVELLTSPGKISELREQIARVGQRTWEEYADDVWRALPARTRSS